jgi:hypothetical protein
MTKLPPNITKCVCFVGSRRNDGIPTLEGTAFLIGRPILTKPGLHLGFAVTARHVVDGIRRSGQQPCLRLTLRTESTHVLSNWVDVRLEDWHVHPDPTVDAAVMVMKTLRMYDMEVIYPRMTLTQAVIEKEGVGVGAEVFMTGLFANHPGQDRNLPIVRVGNIAAMPQQDEKVYSKSFGDMDAFLIEARSLGGLSGSPVFTYPGTVKVKENRHNKTELIRVTRPTSVCYWMGLVHGHYDGHRSKVDRPALVGTDAESGAAVEDETSAGERERVNVGIAIVVPASRILEIFELPALKELEQAAAAATRVVAPARVNRSPAAV